MLSCGSSRDDMEDLLFMDFVLVDSLVFDELQTLRILDYSPAHNLYLMVNQGVEGRYFLINSKGVIVQEEVLSEGPNAFGMVLHRAGFVGDEIMFISDQKVFMYDLNLRKQRDFPFHQDVRVRMIHFPLDDLNTVKIKEEYYAIANLSDRFLPEYPEDYFDTLNYFHLLHSKDGSVIKGGKLDESSIFKQGYFYHRNDKPLFFSDLGSPSISLLLPADSVLFQFDHELHLINKIRLERMPPDQLSRVPMREANTQGFQANTRNIVLGGSFTRMVGTGDAFLVEYKTGLEPEKNIPGATREEREAAMATRKTYYYPIKDGKQIGQPILWDKAGALTLGVGDNRYLQYADQADIHETEKDYQCYYIYELRPVN
jgi:hypothetical protein